MVAVVYCRITVVCMRFEYGCFGVLVNVGLRKHALNLLRAGTVEQRESRVR